MKSVFSLFLVLLSLAPNAFAQSDSEAYIDTRIEYYHATYKVNPDASYEETREWALKVLNERAIKEAKQRTIAYSTSLQKAEVLKAYTLKADGRRIDSPKSNFQVEVNSGKDKDAPVFSDITRLTVVFPDVEVGDSVVFSAKLTTAEAIFPRHFSESAVFPKMYAYDDVRLKVDLPKSLWVQYRAREFKETVTETGGRKIIEWTYDNKNPAKNNRKNYTVYDIEQEPGFAISTFRNHAEIAEAYGKRARPKAAVTKRVQELADDITKDKSSAREQAQTLYEWVATNITYAGNCIGVGTVVPHDISFILDNKMGDCKDHATLLQALLMAKNIRNTQALVNAGSGYRLPEIPVVSMVNHVINYIPELDLYLDSTSDSIPFGMLPFQVADKPVLLVDGHKEGAKTPILPAGENRQYMKHNVEIKSDGSITANVEVSLNGIFAAKSRYSFRKMEKRQEDDLIADTLKSIGHSGTGTFEKDDPGPLLDTYRYKANFDMQEFILWPGTGAFQISPLFFSEGPIYAFLQNSLEPVESADVACIGGVSVEEYVYHLPEGMTVLSAPNDMAIDEDLLAYHATYTLKNNILTARRVLEDKTKGNVCSPATTRSFRKLALKAFQNTREQVVYK